MQKKRRNNRFHTYDVETLFGAWVGTVVGDVLSTTYDKIELSDYKDVLNRGD